MLKKTEADSGNPNAGTRQMQRLAGLVLWACVALQTFELISRHFRSQQMVVEWVMFVCLAMLMTLPNRWPRKVKAPLALLATVVAGYNLYLAGVPRAFRLWVLLGAIMPIAMWVALRRWTTWPWVKSPWVGFALLTVASAIGLWLAVKFGP